MKKVMMLTIGVLLVSSTTNAQELTGFGNNNSSLSILKKITTLTLFQDDDSKKYGYKNYNEEIVIAPKYDDASDFNEELAKVKLKGKWGYIDTKGVEVIPIKYDNAENFNEGKAKVTLNGKTFYIDKLGNKIE